MDRLISKPGSKYNKYTVYGHGVVCMWYFNSVKF